MGVMNFNLNDESFQYFELFMERTIMWIFSLIFVNKIIPRLYDDTGILIIFCKLFCKREESFQIHIIDVHTPTSNFTPLRFVIFLGLLKLDRTCGLLTTQSRNSMII